MGMHLNLQRNWILELDSGVCQWPEPFRSVGGELGPMNMVPRPLNVPRHWQLATVTELC
jgi:hypothetical protein